MMPSKKNKVLFGVLALTVLLSASNALAGKKIVVPHDFPTIYSAIGEADEGDTVYVSNGVYHENIALIDNIVLLGQDMLGTIIDGDRKGPVIIGAEGAVISHFTIRNGTTGILCKATRSTIENNLIVDNKGAGIHALVTLPDISNNIIYQNEWTGIFLESVRGTKTSIDHNVILENGYCGIFCAHRTEVLIRNNVLEGNKQYGIFVAPQSSRTRIIYNNFWENRKAWGGETKPNQSNISQEPLYISPAHPDYNYFVKPVSALKAKGENASDIGLITRQQVEAMGNDKDGDGIPDDVDQCPEVAEDRDNFQDEDGCPDFDNDNDGIPDNLDKCPNDAEDRDGFQDDDGCPDADNDKDKVCDPWVSQQRLDSKYASICKGSDACVNQPETNNGYKDDDGCPDEKPQEIKANMILKGVNFKTASAELLEESYYVLEQVFNSLESYPEAKIEISGHTDSQGKAEDNRRLSLDRAKSVKDYLVMRGISADRISVAGYGPDKPLASNNTAEGRAKNRRVEITPIK